MITLLTFTLIALLGCALVIAGLLLQARSKRESVIFGRQTNGADWPDDKRYHRH